MKQPSVITRIKNAISCFDYACNQLKFPIRKPGDRCVSFRKGATNPTSLEINERTWRDFGAAGDNPSWGDVIDLCAWVRHNGSLAPAIEELSALVGIEIPKGNKQAYRAVGGLREAVEAFRADLTDDYRAYLASRRISAETINELQIGRGDAQHLGACMNERLVIPYLKNGKPVYCAGRAMPGGDPKAPKYKKLAVGPYTDHCIWGVDTLRRQGPVNIAEGIFDAISCFQEGLPVLSAVTGQFSSEQEAVLFEIVKDRTVTVCMDFDPRTKAGQRFTVALARKMFERGIHVSLVLLKGQDAKVDLSDLYAGGTDIKAILADQAVEFWEFEVDRIAALPDRRERQREIEKFLRDAAQVREWLEINEAIRLIKKDYAKGVDTYRITDLGRELKPVASKARQKPAKRKAHAGSGTASVTTDHESKNLTDLGNAERFAHQHKKRALFDVAQGQWRVWDGRRWALDCDGAANRLAAQTARSIHAEAAKASSKEQADALARWAIRSENRALLANMLELAKTMEGMAFPASSFDRDPWLFTVANGTLALHTATLRPFNPEDYITRMSPVVFDPTARSAVFERVLTKAIPDVEVRVYLQELVGYSLTGLVNEEVFQFIHGPTGTSKSTVTEAVQGVFGDYARTASPSTFMKRKDIGNARPDIAELNGARFVLTSEASSEERFDAELLKSFVSGDRLTARFLYARNFEFYPVSKLWITGNSRPRADVVDAALFRRLREIPFIVQVPKSQQDPAIKREMKDPEGCGPAILRWAVEGCLLWQKEGLHDPAAIVQAGREYEEESNPLQEFFETKCVFGPGYTTSLRDMHKGYTDWANSMGVVPRFQTTEKRLSAIIKTQPQCSFERDHRGRFFRGIRLALEGENGGRDRA